VSELSLPEGWQWVKLKELARTSSGTTPSRNNKEYFENGSIPWIKTGELLDNVIYDAEEYVTELALAKTSLKLLPIGTLLIAMYGQGQTRGRTGLLGISATTNQACFAIWPNPDVFDSNYLQYWFKYSYQRLRFLTEGRGGNQPNLNGQVLNSEIIPLPPLPEQHRITAIIEEQMSDIHAACVAIEGEMEAVKALTASYLRQVFESDEAEEWEVKPLGTIALLERGKFTPRPRNDPRYYGGQYPWIQIQEVESADKYITTHRNTLNEAGLGVSKLFPKGTLVISIAATIGALGILTFDTCMPDSLVGITPYPEITDLDYLYYLMSFVRDHLEKIAPQVAQANINLQILNSLQVPVPPIERQRQIGIALWGKISIVNEAYKILQQRSEAIDAMPAAVLRRAFNGDL
jgi:type I restriction enzyme S subunit